MTDIPSIDDLPADPHKRFARLEDILGILRPAYDAKHHAVQQAQDDAVSTITAFLDEQGLSYTFEKSTNPFDINPQSTNIDIVNGKLTIQGKVEEDLVDRIRDTIDDAGVDVIAAFGELHAVFSVYEPIARDVVMRYAHINVIGNEYPMATEAVIFIAGRSPYEVGMRVDMATTEADLQSVAGDPRYALGKEAQAQILVDHASCEHNTYILSHPSRHIDFDDLCRYAIDLIIDRCPGYRAALETKEVIDAATIANPFCRMPKRDGTN